MNFEVYCDESRAEHLYNRPMVAGSYALIGGIWGKAETRSEYKEHIKALREEHSLRGEFKWNRVSPSRLDFYIDIVRYFFASDIRFRVIVLPAERLTPDTFHMADNELMFYKFYYQLLHHWIESSNSYRIFLDLKTNRQKNRIGKLKDILRSSNRTSEILDVQALPSKELDLLQMADVLIGAVGYSMHNLHASSAKTTLIQEITTHIGIEIGHTSRAEQKFNVFRFQPGQAW